jgi:hypothetical protein
VSIKVAAECLSTCSVPVGIPAAWAEGAEPIGEPTGADRAPELVAEDEIVVFVGRPRQVALEELGVPVGT